MPRYRFAWVHVSGELLLQLAGAARLDTAEPASALQEKYGARPKEQFVADLWPVLRDSWLAHDADARARVVEQLRGHELGDLSAQVSTPEGQMTYLSGLRNAKTLREVVVHEFHLLGEPTATVQIGDQQVPLGVSHPLDEPAATGPEPANEPASGPSTSAASDSEPEAASSPGGMVWPWRELAQPPAAGLVDAGPALLAKLRAELMMDDEWVHQDGRHLWWWGAPIPMGFQVDSPRMVEGDPTVKITAYVHLVRDVTADPAKVYEVLAASNTFAVMGGLVYVPDQRVIVAFTTHYAHPGNETVTRLFPYAAITTYARGLGAAPDLANMLGGQRAIAPHPRSGVREDFDEMTDLLVDVAARGHDDSRPQFDPDELASMLDLCRGQGWLANGDDDALCAELPYSTSTPAVFWAATKQRPVGLTSLLDVTRDVERPDLGHGMLELLHLPGPYTDTPKAVANQLNLAEFSTGCGFPSWGAWCTHGEGKGATVTHAGFLPAELARPGLATTNLFHGYLRSQWAQEQTLPAEVVAAVRAGERRAEPGQFEPGVDVAFSRQIIEDYVNKDAANQGPGQVPTSTYSLQCLLWRARLAEAT